MDQEKLLNVPDSVKKRVRELRPKGGSTVAKSPLFYSVLEQLAVGATPEQVSNWTGQRGPGYFIRACSLVAYITTHVPDILTIGKMGLDASMAIPAGGAGAILEAESVCGILKQRLESLKEANEKDGVWNPKLAAAAKEYMDALERLQKMRYEQEKRGADDSDEVKAGGDKWTSEFAAAVAKLIVDAKSKSDGKLRMFQPETIEDSE